MVKLDRCAGSCNTINDLSNKEYFPNKTKDLNLSVFNIMMKFNSNQWWNIDECQCECKKHHICEKDHVWNPATCSCKNEKDLVSMINEILCDKIIDAKETNFS